MPVWSLVDCMDSNGGAPATILLVEDNHGDVRLVKEAFAEAGL